MDSVTFTETKRSGLGSHQSSHYRHNHMHCTAKDSKRPQLYQNDRHITDLLKVTMPSAPATKAAADDGAVMIDLRCLCRERLRVDAPWLGHVWFVHDVCGQVCAVITLILLAYAEFVVMVVVVPQISYPYDVINVVVYNFFAFLAVVSHVRVTLTSPGVVPKGTATDESVQKLGLKEGEVVVRCSRCVAVKPPRAHHCRVCQRCVRKMDHHCPWVNNCVGEHNQKYFVLFTLYIFITCCHAFVLAFVHFIACFSSPQLRWMDSTFSPLATVLLLVSLLSESIAFGVFTGSVLWSQLSNVFFDETGIEQLKKQQTSWEKKSRWMSIKSVFGHPFGWHWFSPFSTPRMDPSHAHLHTV